MSKKENNEVSFVNSEMPDLKRITNQIKFDVDEDNEYDLQLFTRVAEKLLNKGYEEPVICQDECGYFSLDVAEDIIIYNVERIFKLEIDFQVHFFSLSNFVNEVDILSEILEQAIHHTKFDLSLLPPFVQRNIKIEKGIFDDDNNF